MRQTIKILIFMLALVCAASAQTPAGNILSPSAAYAAEAKRLGFEVFKILPRGMFDEEKNEMALRGGGAYFSFATKSHDYNEIPQLVLQKNDLSVGFYGANYGFLADLGETPLADISPESKAVDFLFNYKPKQSEAEAREEYRKIGKGLEIDGVQYRQNRPAIVGHTYLLRAISYGEADTLVAFQIHRRETDKSLIIFWKALESFEKPLLAENE